MAVPKPSRALGTSLDIPSDEYHTGMFCVGFSNGINNY